MRSVIAGLDTIDPARVETALNGPMFPSGPRVTLERLSDLPFLRRVSLAAGAANQEIARLDGGRQRG